MRFLLGLLGAAWSMVALAIVNPGQTPADIGRAATPVPYLRMATWDLGGLGDRRVADKDPALIAEVFRRFDVLGLQGIQQVEDLDGILTFLNSSGDGDVWKRISVVSDGGNTSLVWRSDRVHFDNYERSVGPAKSKTMSMTLVGRFFYSGRPFYAVVSQNTAGKTFPESTPEAKALVGVLQALKSSKLRVPVFLFASMGARSDHPSLIPVTRLLRPVLREGESTIGVRGNSGPIDNIFTDFQRPVRAGYYPFHTVLSLSPTDAARKLTPHLPAFALTTLEE